MKCLAPPVFSKRLLAAVLHLWSQSFHRLTDNNPFRKTPFLQPCRDAPSISLKTAMISLTMLRANGRRAYFKDRHVNVRIVSAPPLVYRYMSDNPKLVEDYRTGWANYDQSLKELQCAADT